MSQPDNTSESASECIDAWLRAGFVRGVPSGASGSTYLLEHACTGDVHHLDEECRHHRNDGPAVEHANGHKEWFRHDVPYRKGCLPTTETDLGDLSWESEKGLVHHYDRFNREHFTGPPCVTAEESLKEVEDLGLAFPVATRRRLSVLMKKEEGFLRAGDDTQEAVRKARRK